MDVQHRHHSGLVVRRKGRIPRRDQVPEDNPQDHGVIVQQLQVHDMGFPIVVEGQQAPDVHLDLQVPLQVHLFNIRISM